MFGTILAIGGYLGADIARRSARRSLFRTMLKGGLVKGVSKGEASVALKEGGEQLFGSLYKANRKAVARFAKGATTRGDQFIRGQLASTKRAGFGPWQSAGRSGGSYAEYSGKAWRENMGQQLAVGVHKYNTLGGIGGVAAMIGMVGIGLQVGGAVGHMSERVPYAPSMEIQNTQSFIMPRQAYTQRQRALQAISTSQLSLRSAFGQEARYMHR